MARPRDVIRDHIQAAMGDGVTVYGAGVDVLKVPAVVINPGDPYMVPTSMGLDARIQLGLEFVVVCSMTSPVDALNQLEDLGLTLGNAIKTCNPRGRWSQLGQFGPATVGDQTYASGVMDGLFLTDTTIGDEQ